MAPNYYIRVLLVMKKLGNFFGLRINAFMEMKTTKKIWRKADFVDVKQDNHYYLPYNSYLVSTK